MSDARTDQSLDQRLALVLRGVQRMADSFGSIEARLDHAVTRDGLQAATDQLAGRLADQLSRSQTELAHVTEVVTALAQVVDVMLREQRSLVESVRSLQQDVATSMDAGVGPVARRDDLRRGIDQVLSAVSGTEQAVTVEVHALDARVGAMAGDLRAIRALRDGLEALTADVDAVRQLAAGAATARQMGDVGRELAAVLDEIEAARAHVLRVGASSSPVTDVVSVGGDLDRLGRRIDQLADVIEHRTTSGGGDDVSQRLRQMSLAARNLGNGVLEDLRSRRKSR